MYRLVKNPDTWRFVLETCCREYFRERGVRQWVGGSTGRKVLEGSFYSKKYAFKGRSTNTSGCFKKTT
jgi:hypothetical protein